MNNNLVAQRKERQKGVALILVLASLIIVSLGILAMTNGVSNMSRTAVSFGQADESYNAATAGLSAARAYIKGLGYEQTPQSTLTGTVGAGQYTTTILYDHEDDPIETRSQDDGSIVYTTKKKYYTVTAVGTSGKARRTLRYMLIMRQTETQSTTFTGTFEPQYDILCGGDLEVGGNGNIGTVHTNGLFDGSGSAEVDGVTTTSGTLHQTSRMNGKIRDGIPPVPIPEPDWDTLRTRPDVTVLNGTIKINGDSDIQKYFGSNRIIMIENGNISINGNVTLENYTILCKGTISVNGGATVSGLLYSSYVGTKDGAEDLSVVAVDLTGGGTTGAIITKAKVKVKGNYNGSHDFAKTVNWIWRPIEQQNNSVQTTVEELLINDIAGE